MKTRVKGRAPLTQAQKLDLLVGWTAAPGTPGSNFSSMAEARDLWEANKAELVREVNPDSEPFAAEVFESEAN